MSSYNPLKECPPSPNCVCTIDTNAKKKMKPLSFSGSVEEAKTELKKMLDSMKRTTLLEEREDYLHFKFKTFWGGFNDDVELYLDENAKEIHFRSASRVGYSDLGANRRRMEKIGKRWRKLLKA